MLIEHTYVCDACGEMIVIEIDPTAGEQQDYVEDCPVCCRPHRLLVTVRGDEVEVRAELED